MVAAFVRADRSNKDGRPGVLLEPDVRERGEGSEGADVSTSIQSLGGKARAANMTPEERTKAARHAATKGARKLGKEGRRLRALKGAATRKARAEAAQRWGSTPAVEAEIDALGRAMQEAADTLQIKGYLPAPLTYGAAIPPGDARRLQFDLAPSDRNAHLEASHRECAEAIGIARPKRPEPRPGTLNARVLGIMRVFPGHMWAAERLRNALPGRAARSERIRNALSSLRSAGHVVSEPKPGSRREKLWRLA